MTTDTKAYWMDPEDRIEPAPPPGEFFSDPRDTPATEGEFSRREFLKLMGLTTVLAGAAACTRRPVEKIIPYLNTPEEVTPGEALWYASTSLDCACQCGVLVKTREGRPIKLEGNPDHPINRGGLCARAQASLWNLYDPDRLQTPVWRAQRGSNPTPLSWDEVDQRVRTLLQQIKTKRGKVRLLTGAVGGPAYQQVIATFLAAHGNARQVMYEPVNSDEIALAQGECYGQTGTPHYRFDRAQLILSLGADFLGTWLSPTEFAHDWVTNRKLHPEGRVVMSRLICIEPILTLTGTNADERYPVRATDLITVALALAHELASMKGVGNVGGDVASTLAPFAIARQAERLGIPAAALQRIAAELAAARGRGLVVGGLLTGPTGVALQIAVNLVNSLLGNDGTTVDWAHRTSRQTTGSYHDLRSLIDEMQSGTVDALIIAGVNPVYNLPSATGLAAALAHVPFVLHVADRIDETGARADAVLPVSHFLESWGDAEPQTGVYSIVQPTIAPLYPTRTLAGNLIAWMDGGKLLQASADEYWYEYLRTVWRERVYPTAGTAVSFDTFWESALRDGAVALPREEGGAANRPVKEGALLRAVALATQVDASPFQFVAYPTVAAFDGRHANNSLLQELPDPVAKITWDNYLSVAPRTAKQLGLDEEDVVEVQVTGAQQSAPGDTITLPVHIQPGTHEGVIAAAIGYGRTAVGRVGNHVGVNIHHVADVTADGITWAGLAATIKKTGRRARLAVTQGHHRIEGRPIIQEATLQAYRANPHATGKAVPPLPSMWEPHKYPGHRWGMAIDLNACTGCSACVIACMVENNVAVVGKRQVLKGREMHWVRIDRYYSGSDDNPETVHQPMLCQQCEKAPCETVCPVLATVHNDEGLNVQIYNRCVGTRYCSNNCPYKVRRFNWFDYGNTRREAYVWNAPLHLMLNPDVTVREKGVMEKCTFCIQRIRKGKEEAKAKGIPVADGDIKTACQQSCPTDAIVFGDLNDPKSVVARWAKNPRGYGVLHELNTLPQVTYLTKIRNPSG